MTRRDSKQTAIFAAAGLGFSESWSGAYDVTEWDHRYHSERGYIDSLRSRPGLRAPVSWVFTHVIQVSTDQFAM